MCARAKQTRRIGWIGLGTMGLPMALRLADKSGCAVYGCDIVPAAMDAFASMGGIPEPDSAALLENSDVVFLSLPGNALVLVAVVAIAINTVIIKPQLERLGTLVVMGWYYIIGLAVTAPFFWKYIAHTQFLKLPLQAQAELAYILILGTVLPMYLLYRGTEKLTSVHTALYRYIQPVTAGILAIVRGQAVFDTANVVALVFIFAGVVLVVIGYKYYVRHGLPPVGSDGKLRA